MKQKRQRAFFFALVLVGVVRGAQGGEPTDEPRPDPIRFFLTPGEIHIVDPTLIAGDGPRFGLTGGYTSYGDEREKFDAHVKRIRANPEIYLIIDDGLSEAARREVVLRNPLKRVFSVNEEKRVVHGSYLTDNWAQQAREAWRGEAGSLLLAKKEIAGATMVRSRGSSRFFSPGSPWGAKVFSAEGEIKRVGGRPVSVEVMLVRSNPKRLKHESLRRCIARKVTLYREGAHRLYRIDAASPEKGVTLLWPSGEDKYVRLSTLGDYPQDVVRAYLRKYPSSLTEASSLDRNEWGRNEADIWLEDLRLEAEFNSRWFSSGRFQRRLNGREDFGLNFSAGMPPLPSVEQQRARVKEVAAWLRENRDRLVWNAERKEFELAPGAPAMTATAPLPTHRESRSWARWLFLGLGVLALAAGIVLLRRHFRRKRLKDGAPEAPARDALPAWHRRVEREARIFAAVCLAALGLFRFAVWLLPLYGLAVLFLIARPVRSWVTARPSPPRTRDVFSFLSLSVALLSLLILLSATMLLLYAYDMRGPRLDHNFLMDSIMIVRTGAAFWLLPGLCAAAAAGGFADLLSFRGRRIMPAAGLLLAVLAAATTFAVYLRSRETLTFYSTMTGALAEGERGRKLALGDLRTVPDDSIPLVGDSLESNALAGYTLAWSGVAFQPYLGPLIFKSKVVYVSGAGLYVNDLRTGETLKSLSLGMLEARDIRWAVEDGAIYVPCGKKGKAFRLDLETLEVRELRDANEWASLLPLKVDTNRRGRIKLCRGGEVFWNVPAPLAAEPTDRCVGRANVYLLERGSARGRDAISLYALERTSGAFRWKYSRVSDPSSREVYMLMTVDGEYEGVVLLQTAVGRIAFDAESGRPLWRVSKELPAASSSGRLYLLSRQEPGIKMRDARTGRLLGVLKAGALPYHTSPRGRLAFLAADDDHVVVFVDRRPFSRTRGSPHIACYVRR